MYEIQGTVNSILSNDANTTISISNSSTWDTNKITAIDNSLLDMDYLKDLKSEIKRLEEVEKYDKKRLSSKTEDKQNYYLEGMKCLLTGQETLDNYNEILNSYRTIFKTKSEQIDRLFEEIEGSTK